MNKETHKKLIIEQFSSQATAYTAITSHRDALDKLINIVSPTTNDNVLDVACGSGIVSLAFAKHTSHVTGVDITTAMLQEAKKQQQQQGITNVDWVIGDADALPFPDDSFSIVVTRFSFHHFINPVAVLKEMIRVCKPGGSVMVADVAVQEDQTAKYDEMEKLRDPSHIAVLSVGNFEELFKRSALTNLRSDKYKMKIDLEEQLNASFSSDKDSLKKMIVANAGGNHLGIEVKKNTDSYSLFYPIYIMAGNKV